MKSFESSPRRVNGLLLAIFVFLVLVLAVAALSFFGLRELLFPAAYRELVQKQAELNQLDPLFVAALIYTESRFGPSRVSPTGDIGLMQIKPSTLVELSRSKQIAKGQYHHEDLKNPEVNVAMGTTYLRLLRARLLSKTDRVEKLDSWFDGDPRVVMLHSYNAGPTLIIQKIFDKADSKADYEKAVKDNRPTTAKYAKNVMGTYWKLQWINWVAPY